jgi:hypothetical protein
MKFNPLLKMIAGTALADYVADGLKSGISPLAPYIRRLTTGVLIVLVSALAWLSGLFFALISLFIYLSDLDQYLPAALWTTGACFLVGFIMVFFGFRLIRKPRR